MKEKFLTKILLVLVEILIISSHTNYSSAAEWQGVVNGKTYNFYTVTDSFHNIISQNPNAFTSNPWWGQNYISANSPVTFARAVGLNLGGSYSSDPNDKSIYGPLFAFGAFQNPLRPLGILDIEAAVYLFNPPLNAEYWQSGSSYRSNNIETYTFAVEAVSN